MEKEKVLSVKNLVISFKTDRGMVRAVRDVSFDLYKGETLCIVGESGSGKSVTNKAIMGISAKNAVIENGQIIYQGEDLVRVSEEEFHRIRGHKIGMIFQDPLSALNPVVRVGKQIIEATMINRNIFKRKYNDLIVTELTALRNNEANSHYNINKLENEIENNNKIIVKEQKLLNEKKTLENKFSSLESSEKTNEKKQHLEESLNTVTEDLNSLYSDYKEYIARIKKTQQENIEKYQKRVEKYNSVTDFSTDLDKKINENQLNVAKSHLDYTKKFDFDSYDLDSLDFLKIYNGFLKEAIRLYKKDYKICNKPLKQKLALSKKHAKVEVKKYKVEVKEEHLRILNSLKDELKAVEDKIASLESSLGEEEAARIKAIIKNNEKLTKKYNKKQAKNREINISKTQKNELVLQEINKPEYEALLKEVSDIKEKIQKEEEDYINKTKITKAEAKKMALEVMREVGIPLPERRFRQYPFEFSGGMRQRIVIAIALTAKPEILICDEPTTALDVTIQAQILELINRLKKERNLSCIFITHDLGVVANMADRVAVMYAGKIVEYGLVNEIFFEPKHPYTWALLSSIPDIDSKEKLEAIPGTPPDMIYPPEGDAFALRNKYALAIDFKYQPPFFKVSDTHYAATWLLHPDAPKVEMPKMVKTRIENSLKAQKVKETEVK